MIMSFSASGNGVALGISTTHAWLFALLCGFILFCANLCFYAAYSAGGSVTLVTTIICLLPFISAAISVLMGGKAPAMNEIIGAAIVFIGIVVLVYPRT
jgi:drug/metabolite transporter (DMT)-like permease